MCPNVRQRLVQTRFFLPRGDAPRADTVRHFHTFRLGSSRCMRFGCAGVYLRWSTGFGGENEFRG